MSLFRLGCPFLLGLVVVVGASMAAEPTAPLPPVGELATFRFADSRLMAELVAAEPRVSSPVALAWDAEGRLFVAEMRDYPNAMEGGQIISESGQYIWDGSQWRPR